MGVRNLKFKIKMYSIIVFLFFSDMQIREKKERDLRDKDNQEVRTNWKMYLTTCNTHAVPSDVFYKCKAHRQGYYL